MSIKNKMIFFGAGASHGSEDDVQRTPPVGKDLFDKLKSYDKKGWGSVPEEFTKYFKDNFENGKIMYVKKNPGGLVDLHRSMACYFYQFIPTPNNLYIKLAKRILDAKWSGYLASINYERLLELSLAYVGLQPTIIFPSKKKKLRIPQIEVLLPHGCCKIFIDEKNVYIDPNQYMEGLSVKINGPIVMAENNSDFHYKINNNKVPPVMCYYEQLKRVTSGEGFIEDQKNRFAEKILEADFICIIGVKVNQNDEHIWGPLAETKGSLLYCSGEKSGKEFKEWKRENRNNRNDKIIKKYFEEGFQEICQTLEI